MSAAGSPECVALSRRVRAPYSCRRDGASHGTDLSQKRSSSGASIKTYQSRPSPEATLNTTSSMASAASCPFLSSSVARIIAVSSPSATSASPVPVSGDGASIESLRLATPASCRCSRVGLSELVLRTDGAQGVCHSVVVAQGLALTGGQLSVERGDCQLSGRHGRRTGVRRVKVPSTPCDTPGGLLCYGCG